MLGAFYYIRRFENVKNKLMNPNKDKISMSKTLIWPENESPCIWMEAGIIDYKLCDRNYDCEHCPFDKIMKSGQDLQKVDDEINFRPSASVGITSQSKPARKRTRIPNRRLFQLPNIQFSTDNYYGYHYWYARPKSANDVMLGLSNLAISLLPTIKDVITPNCSANISKGQTLCWLVLNEGTICLPAPVSGKITRTNQELHNDLNLKEKCSGDKLWFVEIYSKNLGHELECLLKGEKAKSFLHSQRADAKEKLLFFLNYEQTELGQTMQDGGNQIYNIEEMFGQEKYFQFLCKLFKYGPKRKKSSRNMGSD